MEFTDLDLTKTYTYADYFSWNFPERVELIEGKVFPMSIFSNRAHQKVLGYVHIRIANYLEGKLCEVYAAPFDVRIPRVSKDDKQIITVLQPDVCVICDLSKLDKRGCLGAPDIVVEILSPGNNAKELKNKYDVYQEAGVREYWVVSPQNQWVRIYTLEGGSFKESPYYVAGDTAHSSVLEGFSIVINDLFKGIPADE